VRRNDSTEELAYYLTYSPHPVPLRTLVRVAGQRWRVEESFQTGKGLTGLDEHQVRRWTSWHRWATLAMLAPDFLTVITAAERTMIPTPEGMIPITVNEQRRLIDSLILRPTAASTGSCAGPPGDADTEPEHGFATTDAGTSHPDHELRLQD